MTGKCYTASIHDVHHAKKNRVGKWVFRLFLKFTGLMPISPIRQRSGKRKSQHAPARKLSNENLPATVAQILQLRASRERKLAHTAYFSTGFSGWCMECKASQILGNAGRAFHTSFSAQLGLQLVRQQYNRPLVVFRIGALFTCKYLAPTAIGPQRVWRDAELNSPSRPFG